MHQIEEDFMSEELQKQTFREALKELRFGEALKASVEKGWPEIVKELLSQPRSTPKPPPPEDQSPNPEADDDSNSETALMLACRLGHSDIVEILLGWMSQCPSQDQLEELPESWKDTAAIDSNANTALHLAAIEGHDQIVEALLQNNMHLLEKTNEDEKTALQLACESGRTSVVQSLLKNNANFSMSNVDGNMPIHDASWRGCLEIVKALLLGNPDHREKKNASGKTAFLNAAQAGHPELLRYLIAEGADQAVTDPSDNTALHLASSWEGGHPDIVKILLEQNPNLKARNSQGRTPLLSVCCVGNFRIVQLLLGAGADPLIKDTLRGDTVLHLAACSGDIECFKELYLKAGSFLNEENNYGATPLHSACRYGHASIANFLLEKKADSSLSLSFIDNNSFDPATREERVSGLRALLERRRALRDLGNTGDTPLHLAAKAGHLSTVIALLKRNKELLNLGNSNGDTPLHLAAEAGHVSTVEALLKRTKELLVSRNSNGNTPLHLAARAGDINIVETLLKRTKELRDIRNSNGDTPLHLAASVGDRSIVEALLRRNKELLDLKNDSDETALLVACSSSSIEVVNSLLEKGANIHCIDSTGENILHKAVSDSQNDLVESLLKKQVKIRPNHSGRTPLHLACYNDKNVLVTAFLDHLAQHPSEKREILSYKDDWGDTPLSDAASEDSLRIVLEFLKDPLYFSQDSSSYLAADKMWLSETKERQTVNELLTSELEKLKQIPDHVPSHVSRQSTSDASGHETRQIDKFLTEICYWATLNGCSELMGACVSRAKVLDPSLKLEIKNTTWLHIFAIGYDGDPSDRSNLIPPELVPPENRSGLIPDSRGVTPLHLAVKHARLKMVKSFLRLVPDKPGPSLEEILQQTLDERKHTTISLATAGERSEHRDITNLLWNWIKTDAEKQMKSNNGKPNEQTELALELAAQFEPPREEHILKGLLDQIQIPKDSKIRTDVFSLAIYHQLPKVVWWLLSNGAYINERNITEGTSILDSVREKPGSDEQKWNQIRELLEDPPRLTKHSARGGDCLLPQIESNPDDYKWFPKGTIVDFLHNEGSAEATLQLKRRPLKDIVHELGPQKIMDSGSVSYDSFFQPKKENTAIGTAPEMSKTKQPHSEDQKKADSSVPTNQETTDPITTRGKDLKSEQKAKEGNQKQKHDVRWIHVPINDMDCFKNLMIVNSRENNVSIAQHRPLLQFFKTSWSQLDAGNKRYMKPQCLKRSRSTGVPARDSDGELVKDKQKDSEDDKAKVFNQIALYMPFLSWMGTDQHECKRKESGQPESNSSGPLPRISRKHNVTHDYMTLDQYYYVSLPDTSERDGDQVLSRFITGKIKEEKRQPGDGSEKIPNKILIVNQLWLWVLDHKTILTSTTRDAPDKDRNPVRKDGFLQCVQDSFQEQAKELTLSTNGIVELIVATAIGLSQRRDIIVSKDNKRSPLDVFHESIMKVQIGEKNLFDKFSQTLESGKRKTLKKNSEKVDQGKNEEGNSSGMTGDVSKAKDPMIYGQKDKQSNISGMTGDVSKAKDPTIYGQKDKQGNISGMTGDVSKAKDTIDGQKDKQGNDDYSYTNVSRETAYLREVKDIFDELNILKNLIEDQDRVWKQFSQGDSPVLNSCMARFDTPSDIKRELEEMTKQANVVQDALHTLLNLKQKQASIEEAKSAREQSATIMVFTVITIIFLPATFLTGIFALNVTEFPHEGDNVTYKASWIFPIIILVSLGTSAVFFLFAFNPDWLTKYSEKGVGNGEDRLVTSDLQSGESVEHSEEQRGEIMSQYKVLSLFRRRGKRKRGSPPDCEDLGREP